MAQGQADGSSRRRTPVLAPSERRAPTRPAVEPADGGCARQREGRLQHHAGPHRGHASTSPRRRPPLTADADGLTTIGSGGPREGLHLASGARLAKWRVVRRSHGHGGLWEACARTADDPCDGWRWCPGLSPRPRTSTRDDERFAAAGDDPQPTCYGGSSATRSSRRHRRPLVPPMCAARDRTRPTLAQSREAA